MSRSIRTRIAFAVGAMLAAYATITANFTRDEGRRDRQRGA